MTRKYSNNTNQRNGISRGRGGRNRGRAISRSTNNDLHNNNETFSQRTSLISVDAEELERRKKRAERFEKFLDPKQSTSKETDANLNRNNTNRSSQSGKIISKKDIIVKEYIQKDNIKESAQIDTVSNFLELLLLELRLIDLLSSTQSSPSVSKSLSNTNSILSSNTVILPKKQQRLRAHDWFIEKSSPKRLSELGYWDKLFSIMDMEFYKEIECFNVDENAINEWVKLVDNGMKKLSIE
ncbi:2806_t:CDS:2 [Scutellospora calospora]|uniref:2806_t:CDS:1 n=1 Tax=Scutellospora calospora TaxID=85575 RepID=A0ACA9KK57_9GLOM|nr:2806_t:CDS:2 [Scutellospora calospora]